MVKLIGTKKVFFMALLAVLCAGLAYYAFFQLGPMKTQFDREARGIQGEISKTRQDIDTLIFNSERFASQKQRYDFIEKTGFFYNQNRQETRRIINAIKDKSSVLSVRYTLSPIEIDFSEPANEVKHRFVKSSMEFSIDAIEDGDIQNFVFLLTEGFPGIVEITEYTVNKEKNVTQPMLRLIGSGKKEGLLRANIKAAWWTMIPEGEVPEVAQSAGAF